jgi:hypothetical protein
VATCPFIILQVEKRFPDKSVKLLVGCSNGTQYSLEALEALDEVHTSPLFTTMLPDGPAQSHPTPYGILWAAVHCLECVAGFYVIIIHLWCDPQQAGYENIVGLKGGFYSWFA